MFCPTISSRAAAIPEYAKESLATSGRDVAIKVLHPDLGAEWFLAEMKTVYGGSKS